MHAIATVLIATAVAHFVGSAVLFGIVSGPYAVVISPLLALFGWFFVPLEAIAVSAQWMLRVRKTFASMVSLWLATVPASALMMATIGPSEHGNELLWRLAYAMATLTAASASLLVICMSARYYDTINYTTSIGEP